MVKDILIKEFKRDKWILYFSFAIILGLNIIIRLYEYSRAITYGSDTVYNGIYKFGYTDYLNVRYLTGFVAVIISMVLFSYLHNKEKIDLHHRLPLTRKQMYLIKYLKGFLYYAIPFFATVVVLFILDRYVYFHRPLLSWNFVLMILKNFLIVTLVYTVFVLANLLCGMVIYSLLCGTFIILFPSVLSEAVSYILNYYPQTKVSLNEIIEDTIFGNISNNLGEYIIAIVCLTVVIVLLNILNIKLYSLRKSEFVSIPIAIERVKTPLKIISIYGLYFFFELTIVFTEIFFMFIFIVITTIVCELLINQGLRNLSYKNIVKNVSIVSFLVIATYSFVDSSLYESTFVNKSSRDVVLMQVSYNSEMLEEGYVNNNDEKTDTFVYISDPQVIEKIFPVIFDLEENCSRKGNGRNIRIATYEPYRPYGYSHDDSFSFKINLNDESEKELFEYILANLPKGSNYTTAYNLVDSGLNSDVNVNSYYEEYDIYVGGYLQESVYPQEYQYVNEDFKNALNADLKYLSTIDVSEFDDIPITTGAYQSSNYNNLANFPITTQAKNLLSFVETEENPYLVYGNIGMAEINYLINNKEIVKGNVNSDIAEKNIFDYNVQIKYFSYLWNDIYFLIDDLTDYYVTRTTIDRADVISGKVQIKVYTGDINAEVIEKYDLKLITDSASNKLYFGYVVK